MASGKGCDENMDINSGNNWDHGKMLRYYIYNTMKKEGFHVVADVFACEEKLDMFEVVEVNENLLAEWWESFWPRFCSGPAKPIIDDAMALLASMKKSGATSSQQIPSRIGQCIAGKQPAIGKIEYSSHVTAAFLLHMHREAQVWASDISSVDRTA